MIGVAAVEIGVKRLIANLIPERAEKVRNHPLRKILSDVLPTLPIKAKRNDGGPTSLPPELLKELETAVEHRNRVVHHGAAAPGVRERINMLQAISDFLWICDIYQGDHWALEHVSCDTQEAWRAMSQ